MPELADFENCTGCKACESICPHGCIEMKADSIGTILPSVDTTCCTNCHACEKICPALNPVKFNYPLNAFAAWNNNENERKYCASGGIASAIYSWINNINGISVGAVVDQDWTVCIIVTEKSNDFGRFRNSKYCYSDPHNVYKEIGAHIKSGKTIVLIGLPCQIAGYKKFFRERENLYYIDLVCHGVAPNSYLKQHIKYIEQITGVKAESLSFRAPELGTSNYYFTLYDRNGKISYARRSSDGDKYNIAFHRNYSYRENCYHCKYAKPERCSDITLGDYHGLGVVEPCDFGDTNVSLILVNTEKGQKLIDTLSSNHLITAIARPVSEPIQGDAQLRNPSTKNKERLDFEMYIKKYNGNFERTIDKVLVAKKWRESIDRIYSFPKRLLNRALNIIGRKKLK